MAEGYAQATGPPGVAMVTSGPGATNIVTPLADAYMDSIPFVCITGQVATSAIGTDAFQECDTTGITLGVTKHNWLVTDAADIPRVVREAFHVATTGRPGPVLIDVPKDVSNATMEWYWPDGVDLPGYRPASHADPAAIAAAVAARARGGAAGDLRRRRHPEVGRLRGPARAGRADGHPRRHDAHGAWLVSRQPSALPRACPGCTATTRPSRPCSRRTCCSPSAAASTTV